MYKKSMILFETDKKPLTYFLDQIQNRDLALPDFQRSFVWDAEATRELLVSIIRSFPAGTLLLMQGGARVFAPRAFEEAPTLNGTPSFLVLDGQQRLTSLYQAFAGAGTHRYFLNVGELIDGLDADEALEVYTVKRARKWEERDGQARDLMLPLSNLRDFADWKDDVIEIRQDEDPKKLRRQFNEVDKEYIKAVELYQFPVTTLSSSTPVEAVCTIFETLNRTGVKLSVFELLTARAFAHEVQLRQMWEEALDEHPVLADFNVDPYYILQTIALKDKASAKRSAVLNLDIESIVGLWDEVIDGMAASLTMLRNECGVLVPKLLPYVTMLIAMAASWHHIAGASGPAIGARQGKLKRWFWCSVFNGEYENSPNSTAERDVRELADWFSSDDQPPTAVARFAFDPARWREITARQRALYRGTLALLMSDSPRDFHEGQILTKPIIDGKAVDDHHIFPRAYLASKDHHEAVDTILNHTLIDKVTNIRIGKRAPSDYLSEMERELGVDQLGTILESHGIPSDKQGPLLNDDFKGFLEWRLGHLTDRLAAATRAELSERILRSPGSHLEDPESELPDDLDAGGAEASDAREAAAVPDESPSAPAPSTPKELFDHIRKSAMALGEDVRVSPHGGGASFRASRGIATAYMKKGAVTMGIALPEGFDDPRAMVRKRSGRGMWSHSVTVKDLNEADYAVGLVRQAYEAQKR